MAVPFQILSSDPIVGGRYFSAVMTLDATFKGRGRMVLEEICLYEVKEGKIASEQFSFEPFLL